MACDGVDNNINLKISESIDIMVSGDGDGVSGEARDFLVRSLWPLLFHFNHGAVSDGFN